MSRLDASTSETGRIGQDTPAAERLAAVVTALIGELPVRIRAWDGSEAGPAGVPVVELRSPRALRRLLWHPGELAAAQAYVTGEAEMPDGLDETLDAVLGPARSGVRPGWRGWARAATRLGGVVSLPGVIGPPLPAPATQARVRGRRHSKARDRRSISHHYDASTVFYEALLGETMAYSCAYFSSADQDLDAAQEAKLALICDKLGLRAGDTLLDVGCGWGSLTLHAARHVGARVLGVTIAEEQRAFVQRRIDALGLGERAQVRLCDYRDVTGTYDAVASVEMGEHVGEENYATYAGVLHDRVRPGGRVLVQQMSRHGRHPGGGPFIESFIAPDMTMRPVGETLGYLERAGLEVRDVHALREHYVLTVARWQERFEAQADRLTDLVGAETMRVWRLYLSGGAAAFRDGRMGVDQLLMVRPGADHGLAPVRSW